MTDTAEVLAPEYRVLSARLGTLRAAFAKFARRAARLGLPAPSFEVVPGTARVEKLTHVVRDDWGNASMAYAHAERVTVRVHGAAPVLSGWRLAAIVAAEESAVIVTVLPGFEGQDFTAHRENPSRCEHCNTPRRRKDTFVVVRDDGIRKQVGRSCLQDFVGDARSAEQLAAMAGYLADVGCELGSAGEWEEGLVGKADVVRTRTVLAWTILVADKVGYVSRNKADERGVESTADKVQGKLSDGKPPELTGAVEAEIDAILAFIGSDELDVSDPDFKANLQDLAAQDWVSRKRVGLVTAMFAVHRRHLSEIDARRTAATSRYVGEVGVRAHFALELTGKHTFEGQYGFTTIHRFADALGNRVTWFGSSVLAHVDGSYVAVGEKVFVKATVKSHETDERAHGAQTTYLSRTALISEAEYIKATTPKAPKAPPRVSRAKKTTSTAAAVD